LQVSGANVCSVGSGSVTQKNNKKDNKSQMY
jgi:hypothetical protein